MRILGLLVINITLIIIGCAGNRKPKVEQSDKISTVQTLLTEDETIKQMLIDFYTEYITACDRGGNAANIVKKYCTNAFLSNWDYFSDIENSQWIDWDPFLDGQYCDLEWLKTLQVYKDIRENVYNVTYQRREGLCTIRLLIVKVEDGYKIDAVLRM